MNTWRLNNHLSDAIDASGDILSMGIDTPNILKNIRVFAEKGNKSHVTILEESNEYCFVLINPDVLDVDTLNHIWNKMSYGSTIFFSLFNSAKITKSDRLIDLFIKDKESEITVARQMLLQGKREQNLIVKCFPCNKKHQHELDGKTITVATVLKSGGDYTPSYVNHIANSIKENVTIPYTFACLTDYTSGFVKNVHTISRLEHDLPKWWSKIELFKPNKFDTEKIFYIDLDSIIVKNIDHILQYGGNFFGLRDFYHQYGLASGVMCWQNDNPRIFQLYENFMEAPTYHMNNNRFGDQEYINALLKEKEYVQDLYPKEIVSYKKDCVDKYKNINIPETARIICFHGPPRPHQIRNERIQQYWRG
jgi:hypothetical protein